MIMEGGAANLDTPKNIETLERIYKQKSANSSTDTGGPDPPGNGGDDRPEGDDGDGDDRRITADEKYARKGVFAKECLLFNLPEESLEILKDDPIRELKEISKVRHLLSQKFSFFRPAFDLETK